MPLNLAYSYNLWQNDYKGKLKLYAKYLYYDKSLGPYIGYTYQGYTWPNSRTQQTTFATSFPARLRKLLILPDQLLVKEAMDSLELSSNNNANLKTHTCIFDKNPPIHCHEENLNPLYESHYNDKYYTEPQLLSQPRNRRCGLVWIVITTLFIKKIQVRGEALQSCQPAL